jgi:predicted alpha/beta-hydrolase family hydrolase
MVEFADALTARGIDIVTFNFLYSEQKRRLPDSTGRLEECYRAVIEAILKLPELRENRLTIGGKSMGGRIASQVAAADAGPVAGLVFLGYPLHPPGRPDRLRAEHLSRIKPPMLFVQGSRDAFGTPDELRPIIGRLAARADLHIVESGDHSFKVPGKLGVGQHELTVRSRTLSHRGSVTRSPRDRNDKALRLIDFCVRSRLARSALERLGRASAAALGWAKGGSNAG